MSPLPKGINRTQNSNDKEEEKTSAEIRRERRAARQVRAQQLETLKNNKPSDKQDDPMDTEAIANAKLMMGNYMLKTAQDFQVPEGQRMNV